MTAENLKAMFTILKLKSSLSTLRTMEFPKRFSTITFIFDRNKIFKNFVSVYNFNSLDIHRFVVARLFNMTIHKSSFMNYNKHFLYFSKTPSCQPTVN